MPDRFDDARRSLEDVGPSTDLWAEAERRATDGSVLALEETPARRVGGRWLAAATVVAVALVAAAVAWPDDERTLHTTPVSEPTTVPATVSGRCSFGVGGDPIALSGLPPEDVLFDPFGQPSDQTIGFIDLGVQRAQIAVPGVVVIDLVGERVEEVELDRGKAQVWSTGQFVQMRWFTGSHAPCDSFTVTVTGGTQEDRRRIAIDLADRVLLPKELDTREDPDPSVDSYTFHTDGAIWPETAASQAPGVISGPSLDHLQWRSSGADTAVEFGRQVLGWVDAHIVEGQSEPSEDGRSGEVHQIESPSAGAYVEVRVAPTVYGRWFSVYSVDLPGPDASASVSVVGRQVFATRSPSPGLAASATARFDYGGRVAEGPAGQQFTLGFDPDTTGSVLVLFRDESGRVIGAWGTALPAGDFAAG